MILIYEQLSSVILLISILYLLSSRPTYSHPHLSMSILKCYVPSVSPSHKSSSPIPQSPSLTRARTLLTTPLPPHPPQPPLPPLKIADGTYHQRPSCFHHYPHYRELEGSARAGCELCSLIVNSTSSRPRQNGRQAELQREKSLQFWLIRASKTDDLDAKLRFRVNVGMDTGIDKFSLHLEFYKRCGMFA